MEVKKNHGKGFGFPHACTLEGEQERYQLTSGCVLLSARKEIMYLVVVLF